VTLHGAFRRPVAFSGSDRRPKINTLDRFRFDGGRVTCRSRHCNTTVQALEPNVALAHALVADTIPRAIVPASLILTLLTIELVIADAGSLQTLTTAHAISRTRLDVTHLAAPAMEAFASTRRSVAFAMARTVVETSPCCKQGNACRISGTCLSKQGNAHVVKKRNAWFYRSLRFLASSRRRWCSFVLEKHVFTLLAQRTGSCDGSFRCVFGFSDFLHKIRCARLHGCQEIWNSCFFRFQMLLQY